MAKHMIKRSARLDVLKRVLGGEAVGKTPARVTKTSFRASDFPLISEALGKSDAFTNIDVLAGLSDAKLSGLAEQRNSMVASELSDLLSAAKADAQALGNVKSDMGRIINDKGLHFDEIGKSLYERAGKDVDRVITKRRLQRALADAERRASQTDRPRFGDIAIGSGVGAAAGLGGAAYLHNRKYNLDKEKRAADYSMAFLAKCCQLGYNPEELLKEATGDDKVLGTMLNAVSGNYTMDDVRNALDINEKQLYDYPRRKGTDIYTPGDSPSLMEKIRSKEKINELIDTVKKLLLAG